MKTNRIILTGATGMIGGSALRFCLDHPDVGRVTTIGRRSVGLKHARLREVFHDDFLDYVAVTGTFERQDVALYCLGVYTGAVPDDAFQRITVDYTEAFAKALFEKSPQAAFCFLSGQGADPSGKSRMAFARYKGAAERILLGMGFPRVHLFRPGYIYPVAPRKEPNLAYRILSVLYPFLHRVYPNIGVSSDDLAHAMVNAGLQGTGNHKDPVIENRAIRTLRNMESHGRR